MSGKSKTPFAFHVRYCGGYKGEYGWVDTGKTALAETELPERLKCLMIKRSRTELWNEAHIETHQVITVEPIKSVKGNERDLKALLKAPSEDHLFKALEKTLPHKLPILTEKVLEDLVTGGKVLVWCLTRESVDICAEAIEKACNSKTHAPALRNANLLFSATHGEASIKVRNTLAKEFRDHKGAALLIATMDSMPVAISLLGAEAQHYPQLHYLPGTMIQSRNRARGKGITRLHTIFYKVKGTADEGVCDTLLARTAIVDTITVDSDAADMVSQLDTNIKETFEEYMERISAGFSEGRSDLIEDVDAGEFIT